MCSSFTGAFNAFDKDGDGIIKLNVLEVKPNGSITFTLYLKIPGGGVSEADSRHCVLLTSKCWRRDGLGKEQKGKLIGNVYWGKSPKGTQILKGFSAGKHIFLVEIGEAGPKPLLLRKSSQGLACWGCPFPLTLSDP